MIHMYHGTRILSRADVERLLTLEACIAAVEAAFVAHAEGRTLGSGVLGMPVPGGGFHIKAAGLGGAAPLFAVKVNGNFFANHVLGLPRIQGLIALCDAHNGYPLAVMDSAYITMLRTAAATAVAAKHLARADARTAALAGCGVQGRAQLRAVCAVRPLERAMVYDTDRAAAEALAAAMSAELRCDVRAAPSLAVAARASAIVVTCTPSRSAILHPGDLAPGSFVAAVGADAEDKLEIAPALLAASAVVPDLLDQCAAFGDLHHAIGAGLMRREDVRGELGAVAAGLVSGRRADDEVVIFDSTGTALQDVAAAVLVFQQAERDGAGVLMELL